MVSWNLDPDHKRSPAEHLSAGDLLLEIEAGGAWLPVGSIIDANDGQLPSGNAEDNVGPSCGGENEAGLAGRQV